MQTARSGDDLQPGPDAEMVHVSENDLCAALEQFPGVHRLYTGLRTHGHEHRRLDNAMRCGQPPKARFRVRVGLEQFKHAAAFSQNVAGRENPKTR
jgi:hypothetical protein